MIKFDRIGNKLGLAGAIGVLLSGWMVANQLVSEFRVTAANQRAVDEEAIASHSLEGNLALRQMQLAVYDIWRSKDQSEVEKGANDLKWAYATAARQLGIAAGRARQAENRAQLKKIGSLAEEFRASASELQQAQLKGFDIVKKRNEVAAKWASSLKEQLDSPAVTGAPNRVEIEKTLYEADAAFNAIRAASWRYSATQEESLKDVINHLAVRLNEALISARTVAGDEAQQEQVGALTAIGTDFILVTGEIEMLEPAKKELVEIKTLPIANRANVLMRIAVKAALTQAEEARKEAAAELNFVNRVSLIGALLVVATLIGSVAFALIRVGRPLTRLNGALARMAAGELNIEIPGAKRGDEVGDIAKTVVLIRDGAEQRARDEAEALARQQRLAAEQRSEDMHKLADTFEHAVGEIVEAVSSASTELEASAGSLSSTADRAQDATTKVAEACGEASSNVQEVASATGQLTSSVNEISQQVQESARIANEAVDQARRTNTRIGDLSRAASHIGKIVELINTIAEQTNLLALNATIEAARAGDAGRGFAVVASEVKALAEQTSKATGEISHQITGIQAATQESVGAIQEIHRTIEKLSAISSTVAAAVEEQGAATQEIARNVQEAARGTIEVSSNISNVQRDASETGSASSQVLAAAQTLSRDSNRLKLEVGKFLASVRSA